MSNQKAIMYLVLAFVALCGVSFMVMQSGSNDGNVPISSFASAICGRVILDYGQDCDSANLTSNYRQALETCRPDRQYLATDENIDLWIVCMEIEGVDLITEITP